MNLSKKEENLRSLIRNCQSMVIAYSGGVDSSLLAKIATEELKKKAVVVIADSPSLAREDLKNAIKLAQTHGFFLRVVKTQEIKEPRYLENNINRCYYCKNELYHHLNAIKKELGFSYIFNGDNWSDLADYRPGAKAAEEMKVKKPLQEVQLDKKEIRQLAQQLNLANHQKPSSPCLASRIPHGSVVNQKKLKQVEEAEFFLKSYLKIKDLRVRHYEDLAIIETHSEDFKSLKDNWTIISKKFKKIGFMKIKLNSQPLKSGSLTKNFLKNLKH